MNINLGTSTKINVKIATLAVALLGMLSICAQAAEDPQTGHWQLDLSQSKYVSSPQPVSSNIAITSYGKDGVTVSVHNVNATGKELHIQYSAQYNGKHYPRTETGAGAVPGQTVTLTRTGSRTAERVTWLEGKQIGTERWVISADGKRRTVTQFGTDRLGKPINNLQVFLKQ